MASPKPVTTETFSKNLNSLLNEEITLSRHLLQLIGQEQVLMQQPLADESASILQSKLSLLKRLEQASGLREDLMLKQGFDSTPQGVELCTRACAHAPAIRQGFLQLSELAHTCHAANQQLGQLLNRKSGFFNRLLSNLADAGQPSLYQANGKKDAEVPGLRRRLSV